MPAPPKRRALCPLRISNTFPSHTRTKIDDKVGARISSTPTHPPTHIPERKFWIRGLTAKKNSTGTGQAVGPRKLELAYPGTKRSTRFHGSGVQGKGGFSPTRAGGWIWIEVAPCSRGRRRAVASRAVPTGAPWLGVTGEWTRSWSNQARCVWAQVT